LSITQLSININAAQNYDNLYNKHGIIIETIFKFKKKLFWAVEHLVVYVLQWPHQGRQMCTRYNWKDKWRHSVRRTCGCAGV